MSVRLLGGWCTSTSRRSARSPQAAAGASTDATAPRPAAPSAEARWANTYLHVAIDDYSRVAYVEAHDDETAATLVGFWRRAQRWFWSNDMPVDEVMTDNGPNFCSDAFAEVLSERAIVHLRTRPYRPQTNGKAERFNRTLADEFLYARRFRSESERRIRLRPWVHDYNCHRHHTAVDGPPVSAN
jgi:transposase InsO family protein